MSDQYRGTIKQRFAWEDVGGADLPKGFFEDFNKKFEQWEKRRGLVKETNFVGNKKKPNPIRVLKGKNNIN
jgi:hypothetical protein